MILVVDKGENRGGISQQYRLFTDEQVGDAHAWASALIGDGSSAVVPMTTAYAFEYRCRDVYVVVVRLENP
jgi:hypothetical protein